MMVRLMAGRAMFFLLFLVVTYLSVTPNPADGEPGFAATRMIASLLFGDAAYADKVGHFCAYGALGAAARFSLAAPRRWWIVPVVLAAYGISLEGVQYFLDERSADILDALANSLGAITGVAVGTGLVTMLPANNSA